jgi:type IV pilus assembly protein PilB
MDRQKLNISTVEDPVEYHLNGINQTQTHESIGMSFASALRALLRQDPDVIMVGEIRDGETSKIAIQASLTGHLVLSTLHTNDAPSAVTRLINIGVEPYLIGSALNAVVAQRLVRKICSHCKHQQPPDDVVAEHLAMQGVGLDEVWVGKGCDKCRNTGYSGRVGLYEMLLLNDQLRDRIAANPNVTEFRRMCIEGGMVTLRQDGFQKVAKGLTTVDEVLRVTEASV